LTDAYSAPEEKREPEEKKPSTDGAGEAQGGSNLQESEYDVEVKLSDLQADPNNPLYSVKSFEDLGL
jgi:ATP-dependent RNA helicase DDX19/DBP5